MRVEWLEHAEWQKEQISDYIFSRFGEKRELKYRNNVEQTIDLILRFPSIGTIDPLFANRPYTYRSVIVGGQSKMVYRIDGDITYIVAFWDCRQDPQSQTEQTK